MGRGRASEAFARALCASESQNMPRGLRARAVVLPTTCVSGAETETGRAQTGSVVAYLPQPPLVP